MHWIEQYTFILLDFDGLLVNTELLHFQAYQKMCLGRGYALQWDFEKYCSIAHASSDGLRLSIYQDFPDLYQKEPNWAVLYAEKKKAYEDLMFLGQIELMPGVEALLSFIQEKNKKACVVTNSFKEQTDFIAQQILLLATVPFWITRRDYPLAKPAPDPYLKALERFGSSGDRVIGFEDTARGLQSLLSASVEGVLVSAHLSDKEIESFEEKGIRHFSSFKEIFS